MTPLVCALLLKSYGSLLLSALKNHSNLPLRLLVLKKKRRTLPKKTRAFCRCQGQPGLKILGNERTAKGDGRKSVVKCWKVPYHALCRARHNPEPRSEVWWWNLRWSFGGICFSRFSQQKQLENLLPNFAGSSPPISPKTSPTSLWKLLVPIYGDLWCDSNCHKMPWNVAKFGHVHGGAARGAPEARDK